VFTIERYGDRHRFSVFARENGEPILSLEGNRVGIQIYDGDRRLRSSLGLRDKYPGLTFYGNNGKTPENILGFFPQGNGLLLNGSDGKPRASVLVSKGELPHIGFFSENGEKLIWSAP